MSPNAAPDRSLEQRRDALQRANAIRSKRGALKRALKAGETHPVDVVRDVPDYAETMLVADLLLAIPKVGQVKANRVLLTLRIGSRKSIGGLSPRQRHDLEHYLRTSTVITPAGHPHHREAA